MSCNRCRGLHCHPGTVAPRTAKRTDSRLAARFAALASLGASVIHFAVVPNHWHEWMPAGFFFASIALFQLLWARLVLARTTIPVLAAGIMVNLGAIALWALSRTSGAPVGPHAGEVELVQAADLCALLLQIYVVMGAGWVLHRGLRGEPVPMFGSTVVLMGAVGVVALASTVGVASGLRHGHHAPASADGGGHHGTASHDGHGEHHGTTPGDDRRDRHGADVDTEEVTDHGTNGADVHGLDSRHGPVAPPPAQVPAPPAAPTHHDHSDHDHGE